MYAIHKHSLKVPGTKSSTLKFGLEFGSTRIQHVYSVALVFTIQARWYNTIMVRNKHGLLELSPQFGKITTSIIHTAHA